MMSRSRLIWICGTACIFAQVAWAQPVATPPPPPPAAEVAASEGPQGDQFVLGQLKYRGDWDPRPLSFGKILQMLAASTSIRVMPERRPVGLLDPLLAGTPFLIWTGTAGFDPFTEQENRQLSRFCRSGGVILVADASGRRGSGFEGSVRRELAKAFPEAEISAVSPDQAIFRSFYLARSPGGRALASSAPEGVFLNGRLAVVLCPNDLLGAWEQDRMGNWLYHCEPGGEPQRNDAIKFVLNVCIFSVTGTYKQDVVHQPFIQQKLR